MTHIPARPPPRAPPRDRRSVRRPRARRWTTRRIPPEGIVETPSDLEILSGNDLRGVNIDLRHGSDFAVVSATPIGPFAGASCEENVSSGQLRLSCAVTTDTDAPFGGWRLVLRHATSVRPPTAVSSMACEGSVADGNTFAVGCLID